MNYVLHLSAERKSQELCIIESRHIFETPPSSNLKSYVMSGPVAGVIFDMDGTLTEPGAIDFQAMYDRIGLTKRKSIDILTQIKLDLPEEHHENAHGIIIDEEMKGCEAMVLRSDYEYTVDFFRRRNIRIAISTRNCEAAYDVFHKRTNSSEHFVPVLHRDSLGGINKPDPRVAHAVLESWDIAAPEEVWFVGDSMDDMKCGKGAGCRTCLVSEDEGPMRSDYEQYVDFRVKTLSEFIEIIQRHLVVGEEK